MKRTALFVTRGPAPKYGSTPLATRTLLGTRLVDTGSGYCSQNALPVHFGLRQDGPVDVEVTALTKTGRKITRVAGVDPKALAGKPLLVRVPAP